MMHKRMRIRLSYRKELLQRDIEVCDATISHLDACLDCEDDHFCSVGQELYDGFILAQSRAKVLAGDISTNVED